MKELQELSLTLGSRPAQLPPAGGYYGQPQALVRVLYAGATSAETLNLSGETASWVLEAILKLEALGRLRAGWDSYGGAPLRRGAKELTLHVFDWLGKNELPVPAVVLGSKGTIQLEWHAKEKELEVELRDDKTIEFMKVAPDGNIEEGQAASNLSGELHELTQWLLRK